jgi:hypothetical protein
VALVDFIEDTGIPTIAYHHDSYRKRERFRRSNSVLDRPSRFDRSLSLIYNGSDPHGNKQSRIGFVSTRLAGTDGVSLETIKWSNILTGLGHECFYFAGESDWPEERTHLVPEAHFEHPEIQSLNTNLFDNYRRSLQTSQRVQTITNHLKDHLYEFVRSFDLDLLTKTLSRYL